MQVFNFIKKLLPRIERSTVAEDLRTTEKEIINIVKPSWDAAAEYFKLNKTGSKQLQDFHFTFNRYFFQYRKGTKSPSFITEIARSNSVLHDNIAVVQAALNDYVEKDILTEGMTARSAFIIRAASNLSMVSRYLMALLNYVYTIEAEHNDVSVEDALKISKAEQKYVEQNFDRFCKLYTEYTTPTQEFKDIIDNLPQIFVNQKTRDAVVGLYEDDDKIDPFQKYGVSGFVGNPIYRIRLLVARWQNERYESAKAKKQQLELRLLYLQMQQEKKTDAIVVKEISILQDRIEKYDRYLRETEESLEDGN